MTKTNYSPVRIAAGVAQPFNRSFAQVGRFVELCKPYYYYSTDVANKDYKKQDQPLSAGSYGVIRACGLQANNETIICFPARQNNIGVEIWARFNDLQDDFLFVHSGEFGIATKESGWLG